MVVGEAGKNVRKSRLKGGRYPPFFISRTLFFKIGQDLHHSKYVVPTYRNDDATL